ncbi:MAG: TonB-dependent receptor [Thermoanaerobaculia bacterium]
MSSFTQWRKALALAALALLIGAGSAFAQLQTGNLYGKVQDNQGQPLPGVTVTLSGVGATQVQVTNAEGQFRFLGLAPGNWAVKSELEGFSTVDYPNISIAVGRNTSIELTLTPAVEEVITVTSESPLLDERKISTGTTVSQTELEKIPTARDPWVILQQTPGVLVDRVNVGGNESGQQSTYSSPGTNDDNSVWAVDGVVITDMGAIGSSPSYYNFDSFEEMQVTTGGTDVSLATGGVTMNMVTKRGTNEWRFSGRYLLTDDSTQSSLSFSRSDLGRSGPWNDNTPQPTFQQGNKIIEVKDYGIEGGGPIVKDRLWVWGSYGVQKVDLLTLNGVRGLTGPGSHDKTNIESYALKINAQITSNNSITGFYHYGNKEKFGRNAGPTRPAPTTWNQKGPTPIEKLEDTQIFNSNFYLTGMASYVGGGFSLDPIGGGIHDVNAPNVTRGSNRVWRNSFRNYDTDRPQRQAKIDGNYFFNIGSSSHELRFGVGYRYAKVDSFSTWPGQQLVGLANVRFGTNVYLGFNRTDRNVSDEVKYTSLYAQDTLTLGNLVANIGLRYDRQKGHNNASTVPNTPTPIRDRNGNAIAAGGTFSGSDPGFTWTDITPRLGLTYALGKDRKTLLRASYSRFADQLASGIVSQTNPSNYQYGYFLWNDRNGDQELTTNEVGRYIAYFGIDPSRPGLFPVSTTDKDLKAPSTDELVASVEHALLPEFVIGLSATYRIYSDVIEYERLVIPDGSPAGSLGRPHQRSDYVLGARLIGTTPDGHAFNVPVYTLRQGLTFNGGTFQTNGDRKQKYLGLSLTFNKRLANRWLLRGHLTWSDWTWDVPNGEREDPTLSLPGSYVDGGAVLVGAGTTSGSKGNVFINSNWSADISGMYQIAPDRPWGFNVAGNVNARQGYPLPYNVEVDLGDGLSTRNVLANTDVESSRNDTVTIFNARIEKEITFSDWNLTLSVDGFNLFNESTVLQRETNIAAGLDADLDGRVDTDGGDPVIVGGTAGDYVRELISPRVFRFGVRVSFR